MECTMPWDTPATAWQWQHTWEQKLAEKSPAAAMKFPTLRFLPRPAARTLQRQALVPAVRWRLLQGIGLDQLIFRFSPE